MVDRGRGGAPSVDPMSWADPLAALLSANKRRAESRPQLWTCKVSLGTSWDRGGLASRIRQRQRAVLLSIAMQNATGTQTSHKPPPALEKDKPCHTSAQASCGSQQAPPASLPREERRGRRTTPDQRKTMDHLDGINGLGLLSQGDKSGGRASQRAASLLFFFWRGKRLGRRLR